MQFDVDIKYTRRKGSIGLKVSHRGVSVYAPQRTPRHVIDGFLAERRQWIQDALQTQQANAEQLKPRLFKTGHRLPFLGEPLPLSVIESEQELIELDSGQLCIDIRPAAADQQQQRCLQQTEQWLQQQAEDYLPLKLNHWSAQMALQPKRLKIRRYHSRWGSCDQHGRITLNNRLMMAPPAIIDYVVIHELSHLVHLNHSAHFWQLVARFCPHYKQQRNWLRLNTQALQLERDIPLTTLFP